jgi:hypothetical protein
MITVDEINEILSELMRDPTLSVTLKNGCTYTNRSINELLQLKTALMSEINKADVTANNSTFQKCYFDYS